MKKYLLTVVCLLFLLIGCSEDSIPQYFVSQDIGQFSLLVLKNSNPLSNEVMVSADSYLGKNLSRVEVRVFDKLSKEDKDFFNKNTNISNFPYYFVLDNNGIVLETNNSDKVFDFLNTN